MVSDAGANRCSFKIDLSLSAPLGIQRRTTSRMTNTVQIATAFLGRSFIFTTSWFAHFPAFSNHLGVFSLAADIGQPQCGHVVALSDIACPHSSHFTKAIVIHSFTILCSLLYFPSRTKKSPHLYFRPFRSKMQ